MRRPWKKFLPLEDGMFLPAISRLADEFEELAAASESRSQSSQFSSLSWQ